MILALIVATLFVYARAGYGTQGVFLLFGAGFGVIFQRSRFCLVRAFREPFMTGDAEHTRAAALALVVSTLGFAILKFTDLKDKSEWVFPAAGVGALAGGLAFGVGMTLAGGCGAGSLWRAGEGQVKLWVAVACFALGASLVRLAMTQSGLLQEARRGRVPAGHARLGRRDRADRRGRARLGYAGDLERGDRPARRGLAMARRQSAEDGMKDSTRREFLWTSGLGLLAAGCAPTVADYAQKSGRRVVVIGGGWGGATAAKYVRLADPSIEVVLLEPNRQFVSCPFSQPRAERRAHDRQHHLRLRRAARPRRPGAARDGDGHRARRQAGPRRATTRSRTTG